MRDWNTTWNSTSPSSSRTASGSPRAIASASSYASSIVCGAIDAQSCSRSQGQPATGSRSRTMICRSRSMPLTPCASRSIRANEMSMLAVAPQIWRPA